MLGIFDSCLPQGAEMADDAHRSKVCRLCGKIASSNTSRPKEKFKEDFRQYYGVNVEDDSDAIHPSNVCGGCVRFLYRLRKSSSVPPSKYHLLGSPTMTTIAAYAQRNAKEDLLKRESDWFLEIKVAQIAGKSLKMSQRKSLATCSVNFQKIYIVLR